MRSHEITNRRAESFVSCRVGLELRGYQEELEQILEDYNGAANFIVTPLAPPRCIYYDSNSCDTDLTERDELHLIPDLVLPAETWERQIAISIGKLPLYSSSNHKALAIFDKLFKHALYLSSPVVLIDCPETKAAQEGVAHIINQILQDTMTEKLILFRLALGNGSNMNSPKKGRSQLTDDPSGHHLAGDTQHTSNCTTQLEDETDDSGWATSSNSSDFNELMNASSSPSPDDWTIWNSFRSLLEPDHRIGLNLAIANDLNTESDEVKRWTGEPVRMITLTVDDFRSKKGFRNTMRPAGNIREFMRAIALANSLKTSFVVQAKPNFNLEENLECLSKFCDMLAREHPDIMRAWDDTLLRPLQPLSSNLDSSTYRVFENDWAKYRKYYESMIEALKTLLSRQSSMGRNRFVIMVLGAGRGPLVDAMIKAICKLSLYHIEFYIYALDKNYSSIRSLKYKKVRDWDKYLPSIKVEVVEADMRVWEPSDKADIIATELLGSFSDNELSPECIDGTWRFSTSQTISIPRSYSSFLAPICSYRMEQELHKSRFFASKTDIRDQLQVVRLSNYYTISEPQELFTFVHSDLSQKPEEGANEREVTLRFFSKVDTVCHGFAGYFTAQLFGPVFISTVPSNKTPTMESWFSAFIPLEKPIQMPANTCLEVRFYRKESYDKVWYEWMITKPETSKIHSQDGNGTSMSKLI